MKRTIKLNLFFFTLLIVCPILAFSQAGKLDSTFGVNGIVTTDFGTLMDMVTTMVRQSDGKIILGGSSNRKIGERAFALARYNANGSPDNTFDSDGKLTLLIGTDDAANSMTLQTDGKIVLAGGSFNGTYADVAVLRFKTNGTLDSSFNKVGYITTAIGTRTEYARAVAIQTDGKIVTGGAYNDNTEFNFLLTRYNSNGKLDSSFSSDGIVTLNIGSGNDIINSLVLQPDGKILVTGTLSFGGGASDFVVARFNIDGTLDDSFGSIGKTITSINPIGEDYPTTILLQSDGKIIVVGNTDSSTEQHIAMVRYNKDGSLDPTFSSDGKVTTDINSGYSSGNAATLQPDGKIVVTGSAYNGTNTDLILARYNSDGNQDNKFGKGGIQIYSFTDYNDIGSAVIIQPDSKIIVGGSSTKGTNDYYFTLSRHFSKLDLGIIDLTHLKNDSPEKVLIYPNPVNDLTNLEYTLQNEEIITIQLIDLQGKIIKTFIQNEKQFVGRHEQVINLPVNLVSGTYLINISSPNGEIGIKVMK